MKKLFYLTSGLILSTSFLSITDANAKKAKMVSPGLITTKDFVDIKKSVNVRGKCDANEAVYLMHVMMPNPNFKAVVRTGTYTRLFKDRGLAKKYFKKLCKTKNYKNIKLLPKPLFKL